MKWLEKKTLRRSTDYSITARTVHDFWITKPGFTSLSSYHEICVSIDVAEGRKNANNNNSNGDFFNKIIIIIKKFLECHIQIA